MGFLLNLFSNLVSFISGFFVDKIFDLFLTNEHKKKIIKFVKENKRVCVLAMIFSIEVVIFLNLKITDLQEAERKEQNTNFELRMAQAQKKTVDEMSEKMNKAINSAIKVAMEECDKKIDRKKEQERAMEMNATSAMP